MAVFTGKIISRDCALLFLDPCLDIASAIHYCSYYPKQTYGYAFIFSLTGYLGIQVSSYYFLDYNALLFEQQIHPVIDVQIVLGLVRQFGAFLAVTVTTFRYYYYYHYYHHYYYYQYNKTRHSYTCSL